MNYRLSTVKARETYTADKTEIIDLDMADPVSQLIIELAVTGVGDVATAHAIACLSKIEVVDGSDVLFSLSGYEAEAVDICHNKTIRSNWNPYLTGNDVQRFIGINFGRYLWDPILAFDPKKFRNPQLKLTLDIDAGGNNSNSNKLQVWAALFDQKSITPMGFLMHKELKSYTMTASGHEYTDMPTDYPYRKLFVRNLEAGTEPCQNIANIKLSEDQDKRVVFDHEAVTLLRAIAALSPQYIEQIMFAATAAGVNVFTTVTERATATFAKWAAASGTLPYASYGSAGGRMVVYSGSSENAVAIVAGYVPHGAFEIPFGEQMDPEDWYMVNKGIGSLKLDITGASGLAGTETCQIFLQQLRPY
jgi:hypothetical protein